MCEMSTGQMVEDVRLAVAGKVPVYFTVGRGQFSSQNIEACWI